MNYADLEKYVGIPRLSRFLAACGNVQLQALDLYRTNLRVCQAFYPVLSLFEILLRNSIHTQLARYYGANDWISREKMGFMSDASLAPGSFYLRTCVMKAENKIRATGGAITESKIIAEQSLGFWTALYGSHHFALMGGSPLYAFPNKPRSANRARVSSMLKRIQDLRNRIYHNEPICFLGSSISFLEVRGVRSDIYELLNWIDPAITTYVLSFDRINAELAAPV